MIKKIPMCRAAFLSLPLLFATYFVSAYSKSAAMIPPIAYPETKQGDVIEKLFGPPIADPYRWLENDVRSDKEVASWVEWRTPDRCGGQSAAGFVRRRASPGRGHGYAPLRQVHSREIMGRRIWGSWRFHPRGCCQRYSLPIFRRKYPGTTTLPRL